MADNAAVEYLAGREKPELMPFEPFCREACEFLYRLSEELKKDKEARQFPDVLAFAFWCRKGNISRLKADFEKKKGKSERRMGRGMAFHITPSNVPVNFAFSFAFGILSGNANAVRVPSKKFKQTEIICGAIKKLFKNRAHKMIAETNVFVRYGHDEAVTAGYSSACSCRVIWGGDETIRNIRTLAIPERCVEVVFADRYSLCVLDAGKILKLEKPELKRIAERFFNDSFFMDQNACSSPHLIVWAGKGDKDKAKELFWESLRETAEKKYELAEISAVDKYTQFCADAIRLKGEAEFRRYGNILYVASVKSLPQKLHECRGKYGYFYEYETSDINEIAPVINEKFQTITYFGADKDELADFVVKNRLRVIDRIVPVGSAMDMNAIWDGYDIISVMSRIIDVV